MVQALTCALKVHFSVHKCSLAHFHISLKIEVYLLLYTFEKTSYIVRIALGENFLVGTVA